ncbi:MAG: putative phosphoribosyl transferase [Chroococcidiopsis sp. SAG 2025]|nr:putative phosphoribosyl transferase [Chroococcidiopsis sp. SAG 2025]
MPSSAESMSTAILFRDRVAAGEQLAPEIHRLLDKITAVSNVAPYPIVYALPRGGLPVAVPVARRLRCPIDIVVAKKIGHPQNPELAIGAVTADGNVLWAGQTSIALQNSPPGKIALEAALSKAKLQMAVLNSGRPQHGAIAQQTRDTIAILVDDGVATGMTMAVAAQTLRSQNHIAVWLCTPVAPQTLLPWLEQWGDRIIVLHTPKSFLSVSRFYEEFPQVETRIALACLQQQKLWLGR